jgi:hypothetical protein
VTQVNGYIKRGLDSNEPQYPTFIPILLAFRPLDANFARFKPADFRVSPVRGKIGDVVCVIIETIEAWERPPISFWLDPARDYIVLRKHETLNGQDTARTDISYRNDPTYGWIPDAWKYSYVGNAGTDPMFWTDKVTASGINVPIPASEFQFEFPKGTRVTDLRNEPQERRRPARAAAAARKSPQHQSKPVYDPFADAVADVEAALKAAKQSNKRVMVEFGANWSAGCRDLGVVLKENAAVSADLQKSFVLVLVDTDTETGRKMQEKYVPKWQRYSIPHLAVLDSEGKVLRNDDTTGLGGDDFNPAKIRAFLAQCSPPK